ncbi:hypothetical protein D9M69_720160 [compost metagenome]
MFNRMLALLTAITPYEYAPAVLTVLARDVDASTSALSVPYKPMPPSAVVTMEDPCVEGGVVTGSKSLSRNTFD